MLLIPPPHILPPPTPPILLDGNDHTTEDLLFDDGISQDPTQSIEHEWGCLSCSKDMDPFESAEIDSAITPGIVRVPMDNKRPSIIFQSQSVFNEDFRVHSIKRKEDRRDEFLPN